MSNANVRIPLTERIAGYDAHIPLHALEDYYLPQTVRIQEGVRDAMAF